MKSVPGELPLWVDALRTATGLPLALAGPEGPGADIVANGVVLARLSSEALPSARLAEIARILSRLAEDHVVRRDLVAQMARLWKEQNFLTSVATSLTAEATPEEIAQRLLPRVLRLLGVTRASILLARPDGGLVVAAGHGLAPTSPVGSLVPPGGVADRVFKTGEPALVEDTDRLAPDDPIGASLHREARSKSFLSVPIVASGVAVGVINVTDRVGDRPFSAEDQKLVMALAAQLGIALANVRLLAEARRAEAWKRELDLAATIQKMSLPRGPFATPGYEVFGRCEPAALVGGDSYEAAPRKGGGLWAAILDVSGHGISAALLMASARSALKALLSRDPSPGEAARALNQLVASDTGETGMFLTATLVRIDADGTTRLTSLGHPPTLVRRKGGRLESFDSGGAPAGVSTEEDYPEEMTRLLPGDTLLLYTDGLLEADGGAGAFGEKGIATRLASDAAPEELTRGLFSAVYDHLAGRAVKDDVTVLAVRRTAEEENG